mmetsp:Transcript_4720/g.11909  ORF Transcript_4720/g.11909 Transcript_4720/m.11909 type:complete len:242 (+) Transcript_4720:203-928(+)
MAGGLVVHGRVQANVDGRLAGAFVHLADDSHLHGGGVAQAAGALPLEESLGRAGSQGAAAQPPQAHAAREAPRLPGHRRGPRDRAHVPAIPEHSRGLSSGHLLQPNVPANAVLFGGGRQRQRGLRRAQRRHGRHDRRLRRQLRARPRPHSAAGGIGKRRWGSEVSACVFRLALFSRGQARRTLLFGAALPEAMAALGDAPRLRALLRGQPGAGRVRRLASLPPPRGRHVPRHCTQVCGGLE